MVKHDKCYAVKLSIGFPSLISGILMSQKSGTTTIEDKSGVALGLLNFNYKFLIGKYVPNITPLNVTSIDESSLVVDEDMIDVTHMSRPVRKYILKELIHEVKALQKIIAISIARKYVCEGLIKILSL